MRKLIIKILVRMINLLQKSDAAEKAIDIIKKKGVDKGVYVDKPKTTIAIQFFNKSDNIRLLWENMSKSGAEEIIVQEDGSSDGSLMKWAGLATGKNHFIIRSNDLFEVRTYDRSIDFARGRYIALLQDDDIPPPTSEWIERAEHMFEKFDDLAIIGGRSGVSLLSPNEIVDHEARYKASGDVAEVPGLFRYRILASPSANYDGIQFEFVEVVNRAPMFVRRDAIKALGGIDQAFAPFQCDDVDICLRAWLAGFKVGLYASHFAYNIGVGGMRLYNKDAPNVTENWKTIYKRYGNMIADGVFEKHVAEANKRLME